MGEIAPCMKSRICHRNGWVAAKRPRDRPVDMRLQHPMPKVGCDREGRDTTVTALGAPSCARAAPRTIVDARSRGRLGGQTSIDPGTC